MNDESWLLMTKIVEYMFIGMIFSLLLVFIVGTICRFVVKFINRDCWFKRFFTKPLVCYSIKRTQSALITIVLIATATFLLLRLLPDNVYYMDYIQKIPVERRPAAIASARAELGLDQPVIKQLLNYYRDILPIKKTICVSRSIGENAAGSLVWKCNVTKDVYINFGTSLILRPGVLVTDILYERAAVSFVIGFIACIGQIVIGYPLGVFMASKKDKFIDKFGKI